MTAQMPQNVKTMQQSHRLDVLDTALDALDLDLLLRRVRRSEVLSEPVGIISIFHNHLVTEVLTARVVGIVRTPVASATLVVSSTFSSLQP